MGSYVVHDASLDLATLTNQLERLTRSASPTVINDSQRRGLIQLLHRAQLLLESPYDTVLRFLYLALPLVLARIGLDHGIFKLLLESKDHVSLEQITEKTKLDPVLVERIMDYLCSQYMAQETSQGNYVPAEHTKRMVSTPLVEVIIHTHDMTVPSMLAFNENLKVPNNARTAFQDGNRTSLDFYGFCNENQFLDDNFHRLMENQYLGMPDWLDVVNFEKEIAPNLGEREVAFVDIGGSKGQQCRAFKQKLPNLKGRVILQDRPEMIAKSFDVGGMEKMCYNFLTIQPIRKARAYYFRQVLHNYDDDTVIRILQAQVPAMGPDSFMLIGDKVLPDTKHPPGTLEGGYQAGLSLVMTIYFNGQERTESHWRRLLLEAGLYVREVKTFSRWGDSIIIAAKQYCQYCADPSFSRHAAFMKGLVKSQLSHQFPLNSEDQTCLSPTNRRSWTPFKPAGDEYLGLSRLQ